MRRRQPESAPSPNSSDIPAELLDLDAEIWVDTNLFNEWSIATFGKKLASTPSYRFHAAVEEWAAGNGYMSERREGVDWDRLREIGIRRMGSLQRARLASVRQQRNGPSPEPEVVTPRDRSHHG